MLRETTYVYVILHTVPCVSPSDPENGNLLLVPLTQVSSRTHALITVIVGIIWRVTDKQAVVLMC